jgi:Heterokaryon incompatibility protein (HET)
MAGIDASLANEIANELTIILPRSLICIVGGVLASLGDSSLRPFLNPWVIAAVSWLLAMFASIENVFFRTFAASLVLGLSLSLDSITIVLALIIIFHFNLPPYIKWMSFEATDVDFRAQSLRGAIPMTFYVSTVLFIRHASAIWSFIWHTTFFGLPSIIFSYQIWSRIVSQRGKEVFGDYLLKSSKCICGVVGYRFLWTLETSKTLLDAAITLLDRLEAIVIRMRQQGVKGPYKYKPLKVLRGGTQRGTTTRQIRLLRLLRRNPFTEMRCELITVNIDNAPPYEAISYTWRNEEPSINIVVNKATLKVTPAVSEILGYRHSFTGTKLLWIDSICINQKNKCEKGHQVPLMKEIYSRASRVVVWLGPLKESKDAYLAVELLVTLDGIRSLFTLSDDLYRNLIIKGNPGWYPMVRLFKHPWFSRVWVVQEVAVARTVHVMYGNTCFEWDFLAAGIEMLADPRFFGPAQVAQPPKSPRTTAIHLEEMTNSFPNAAVIAGIRNNRWANRPMSLSTALSLCRGLEAGLPQDKVYAMLGIIWDRLPDYMATDYSKPASRVYEDTMRYLLSRPSTAGQPHALQFAGTGWLRSPDMEKSNLPSWVADWGSPSPNGWLGMQSLMWANRKVWPTQHLLKAQVMDGSSILKVEAVKVDTIRSLGKKQWGSRDDTLASMIENYAGWLQEAKSMSQPSDGSPRTHDKVLYASFWRTLTGGGDDPLTTPEPSSCARAELLAHLEAFWELSLRYKNSSSISEAEKSIIAEQIVGMSATVIPWSCNIGSCYGGNLFCVTGEGHFATVPPCTREGDSIYFLHGLQSPFILRDKKNLVQDSVAHYELVGSCYVDGMMEGNKDGFSWEEYILE